MDEPSADTSSPVTEPDGSVCLTEHLLKEHSNLDSPTVICFHGSGIGHFNTWDTTLRILSEHNRVVFLDRGLNNPSPHEHIQVLWNYLTRNGLPGPYVLIAHSYGGTFAKHFLFSHDRYVRGIVLAETGKADIDRRIESKLCQKGRLSRIPLSVIRANSSIQQWRALDASSSETGTGHQDRSKLDQRETLKRCDEVDEKLEKGQLKLSSNSRYVHLPNCGHNVIRERQDVVIQEAQWVLQQPMPNSAPQITRLERFKRLFASRRND